MKIIVDSGSTKSDWVVLDGEEKKYYSTIGFNPYFHKEDTIVNAIREQIELCQIAEKVNSIFFYGAGCSSEELNSIVKNALSKIFIYAKITVDHDLTACALSTYDNKPAISCILGTGSNSCYFDGENVKEEIPALGYILGDEGSGSYFGKQLLSDFLYKKLPASIEKDLIDEYQLSKEIIVENVYMKPNANVYIASFMKFIAKHASEIYIQEMVYKGFKKFMETHVFCYPNFKELEVNFIGSIAFIFKNQLEQAANELDITLGKIIQKPIEGLIKYHKNHILA